jgi:AcrR family transcriptional regulator
MIAIMGLRELKVGRTRERIVDVALELFIDQGYDVTTMEQIAQRAEIGSTTLYRYFPGKDLLILDRFRRSIDLGALLRTRPAEEALSIALGAALHESLDNLDDGDGRLAAIRRLVDNAPLPRARLWDLVAQAQRELESAIAERVDRPIGDLLVVMTAHITFAVLQIVTDKWRAGDHHTSPSVIVDEVLSALGAVEPVIPTSPPPTSGTVPRGRKSSRKLS